MAHRTGDLALGRSPRRERLCRSWLPSHRRRGLPSHRHHGAAVPSAPWAAVAQPSEAAFFPRQRPCRV